MALSYDQRQNWFISSKIRLNDLEYINYIISSPACFGGEQKEFERALESETTWHLDKEFLAKRATSSTVKFTPHHYYNEPLLKLLKNPNLRQIWASTNNNSNEEFWIRLAQFGLSRAFNGDSTFTELVALMVQIKEKKFQGKSLKGLRYSEHLIHFFSLLSESSREYEIFRKAFAGFSIQRIW
ncbi:hypothetical protein C2G38_2172239 [Gigaspora rosea]|uniref:Uncharacterized protein n=1 Tax=Gigaspora rosea TaxID=44941 RepID=A0A397VKV4_9GLOM|nr:hypothetical protein C2G38_2172239 [Gigaspora rosea]